MSGKKIGLFLALAVLLAGCTGISPQKPVDTAPGEVLDGPDYDYDDILTSVKFFDNQIYYAGENGEYFELFMRDTLRVNPFDTTYISGREYGFELDRENKKLIISYMNDFDREETLSIPYMNRIIPSTPLRLITLPGEEVEYYFFVNEEIEELELFLGKQIIPLQFGKSMKLEGTDTDFDGSVDRPYYLPDWTQFGMNPFDDKRVVAHFLFDEKGTGTYNVKVFFDTLGDLPIKPGKGDYYKTPVMVDGQFFGELDKTMKNEYGSEFEIYLEKLVVYLPI